MRTLVRRSFLYRLGLFGLASTFAVLVIASGFWARGARIDLTSDHLYSLSPGTLQILGGLHRPVGLTLYFSRHSTRELPQLRSYEQRVRELLQEIVTRSHGLVRLSVVDPVPYSDDEDRALGAGLSAMPGGSNGERVFFGLVGRTANGTELQIPFFDPSQEAFLEYNVARLIYELDAPRKPRVGIISTLPIDGSPVDDTPPWAIMRQLHQLFDLQLLDPDNPSLISNKLDVLMVVHPHGLSDDELYAIDQFVMRGGHLVVFVDPDAEMDALPIGAITGSANGSSSDLPRLFKAWGVVFDPHSVLLDRARAMSISLGNNTPVRDFAVLGLGAEDLNHHDVITASLQNIDVSTSGYFELARDTDTRLDPLLQSSGEAMPTPAQRVEDAADPTQLYQNYRPTGEHYVIAARVRGRFSSAFPDRRDPGHLKRMARVGEVVLVADTDLLSDRLWVRRTPFLGEHLLSAFANNGDFVANILDNLGGSSALLSIRGRAISQRPFTRVQALRRAADVKFSNREDALENELATTEQQLAKLQPGKGTGNVPDAAAKHELEKALRRKLAIRRQLRDVQHQLDAEIDALGTRVKAFNILLVPVLVALFGLLYGWIRQRRSGKRDAT